jgi:two-component system response regulator GlrR
MSNDSLSKRLQTLRNRAPRDGASETRPVVVVVDDDQQVLGALTLVLQSRYTVRAFTNPVEGAVAACRPDVAVVILDIMMPEHDGFWVFAELRKRNPQVPVIFNSAHQNIKSEAELASMGAYRFLSKTADIKTFLDTVDGAVKQSA